MAIVNQFLSIILTPFLLMFRLPGYADNIVAFFAQNTVTNPSMAPGLVLIHILTTLVIGDVYVRADYKTDSAESQVASAMFVFSIHFCIR
jgi:hypothetical protein